MFWVWFVSTTFDIMSASEENDVHQKMILHWYEHNLSGLGKRVKAFNRFHDN
jgi:hypothetical protein